MSSLLTLAGIYRGGKVEFTERPAGVGEDVPVLVTFLPENQRGEPEPSAHAVSEGRRAVRERFMARLKQGSPNRSCCTLPTWTRLQRPKRKPRTPQPAFLVSR